MNFIIDNVGDKIVGGVQCKVIGGVDEDVGSVYEIVVSGQVL